jgi:magnesium chelatase subunit D
VGGRLSGRRFPFTAVVGQEQARLALLLAAMDPAIGGVLLRGDKGSAKSTLARGLAGLLPGGAPFVELPVGATEDRVVGGLDLGEAFGGTARLRPGLLAAAHGGVLYVDEVNLLPDHLVDLLLDAAASGVTRVERDGMTAEAPARFVLVGSMNPEEGELRPQLLDRFGLAVEVRAPLEPGVRAAVVMARLGFDAGGGSDPAVDPAGGSPVGTDAEVAARLAATRPASLAPEVVHFACRLAVAAGAEGLRADLVLCRAAAARAGWEGREDTTQGDVEAVAALALAHRRRRRPLEPPGFAPGQLEEALDQARGGAVSDGSPPQEALDEAGSGRGDGQTLAAGGDSSPSDEPAGYDQYGGAGSTSQTITGRWGDLAGDPAPREEPAGDARLPSWRHGPDVDGPLVGDQAPGGRWPRAVAPVASVRASLARRVAHPASAGGLTPGDVREPVRRRPARRCCVLVVDASGSMGTGSRLAAATGAALGLLGDAYRRRHRVAMVACRGAGAEVVLPPTASVELARARLAELPTGGATPLAEALEVAVEVAFAARRDGDEADIVVLTDGRATAGPAALDRALDRARQAGREGMSVLVLDVEDGPVRLGLARRLADSAGGRYLALNAVTAGAVEAAIRQEPPA